MIWLKFTLLLSIFRGFAGDEISNNDEVPAILKRSSRFKRGTITIQNDLDDFVRVSVQVGIHNFLAILNKEDIVD